MSVHAVIPVFNRLAMTQELVASLRQQELDEPLHLIIVDDGSTDGTAQWLAEQSDIAVLKGDGSLFWGGAVDLAFTSLMNEGGEDDWVLLLNNDTTVDPDFVQRLVKAARDHAPAAVGSVIRDSADHQRLLSIGVKIDAHSLLTHDLLTFSAEGQQVETMVPVDALSGRGVLFPLRAIRAVGGMRPRLLPHYLADYEISLRIHQAGWRLFVLTDVAVYSADEYGSQRRFATVWDQFFSVRSPHYLPAYLSFWWQASSWGND